MKISKLLNHSVTTDYSADSALIFFSNSLAFYLFEYKKKNDKSSWIYAFCLETYFSPIAHISEFFRLWERSHFQNTVEKR